MTQKTYGPKPITIQEAARTVAGLQTSASQALTNHPNNPNRRPVFTWANITCGEACWHAKDEDCKCSCAGANHGCLKTANGQRPIRTAKIAGKQYELAAVGDCRELFDLADKINGQVGWRDIDAREPSHRYHYHYRETEDGAPARLKPATPAQVAKWVELQGCKAASPYLLWKLVKMPAARYCPDHCERCDRQRVKYPPAA